MMMLLVAPVAQRQAIVVVVVVVLTFDACTVRQNRREEYRLSAQWVDLSVEHPPIP